MKYVPTISLIVLLFLRFDVCFAQRSDSLVMKRMATNDGIVFTNDNRVVLFESGQEKFDDMFSAIRQAKSSVHLEYFNFRNDSIAGLLFNILKQKVKEGVEVRALFDGFGNDSNNRPLHRRYLRTLRESGIQIYEFDPIRFPWVNHVWHRDHRKIVVIDGKIAYTGGMNVADYYIKGTDKVGAWRDMHCRIEGSAVATLQNIFLRIWNKTTHQNVFSAKYFPADKKVPFTALKADTTTNTGHKTVGIVNREPYTSNAVIRHMYMDAITSAQHRIMLINPYLTLNHKLKKALRDAVRRGVDVEIMVSSRSDIPLTPDCVFYNVHRLMKHGCKVWLYNGGFHHSKIIMVDSLFCTVGSANLNSRSLNFDYEENALIMDAGTTGELIRMFERDKQQSTFLTPQSWDAFRTPWQKFRGWLAHLLTPFL